MSIARAARMVVALIALSFACSAVLAPSAHAQDAGPKSTDQVDVYTWMAGGQDRMNAAIKEFMDKAGKPMDWSNGAPVTPSEKGAESPSTGSPAPSGSSGVQEATQTPTVDAPVAGTNTDTVDAVASSSNVDDYDSPVANAPPPQPSDYATSNPGGGGERLDPRLSDEYVEYGGDPNSLATGDTCSGACTAQ